mgnify:CR=1 FL=1
MNEIDKICEAMKALRLSLAEKYGVEDHFGVLKPLMNPEELAKQAALVAGEEALMELEEERPPTGGWPSREAQDRFEGNFSFLRKKS